MRNALQIRIEEVGASFEVESLPTVMAHRALMRQLFQNLIDNALKYRRPDDPPRIRVYSQVSSDGVEICVADSGIGFSDEAAERLFEPFTRLVGAEVASGAGIGMATARRIMDRFDGRISARGLPGQGAIFTMWFPMLEAEPDAPSAIPVPCQLLLVDDSVEDRLIARRFIDKDLFTILEADSAEAAMKILRRETVHVVLSDFRMPGTDGLELLQQIRNHYPHIRTMLCSGGRLPEAVAGDPVIQAHFEKPPNAAALSEAVFGEGDVPEAA